MRRARVVGRGGASGGDDAVGLVVAAELAARGVEASRTQDAAALVELALDVDLLVVVDAVVGLGAPGRVVGLTEDDLGPALQAVSTHAVSLPAALAFARLLYPDRVAPAVRIVGVAIDAPRGPAEGLSPPVAAAVSRAVEAVITLLGSENA